MKVSPKNSLSVLFLLLLQVQQAQGIFWCEIFGFLTQFGSGPVKDGLNGLLPLQFAIDPNGPYTAFEVSSFNDVVISGCTVRFGVTLTQKANPTFEIVEGFPLNLGDLGGTADVTTTFDFFGFLFRGFQVCFEDTALDVEIANLPGDLASNPLFSGLKTILETTLTDALNDLFPNPTCF